MSGEVNEIKPFTVVRYKTKDGDIVSATKNNGVVTLSNEKGEIRQLPLEEFMTNELPKAVSLEKVPEKDTVEITAKEPSAVKKREEKTEVKATEKTSEEITKTETTEKEDVSEVNVEKSDTTPAKEIEAGQNLDVAV